MHRFRVHPSVMRRWCVAAWFLISTSMIAAFVRCSPSDSASDGGPPDAREENAPQADAADVIAADADAGPDADGDTGSSSSYACGSPKVVTVDGGSPEGGATALLDLGHTRKIDFVYHAADRVLAADSPAWIVWDTTTAGQIARGSGTIVGAGGSLFAVRTGSQLELRSVTDGTSKGSVAAGTNQYFGVASDGSYAWGSSTTALTVWSPAGAVLFARSGNYAQAFNVALGVQGIHAAAGEIRVATGPAGASVIETIAVPSQTVTVSPAFPDAFASWFRDGSHFFTKPVPTAAALRVYKKDATFVQLVLQYWVNGGPGLGGSNGNSKFFWTFDSGMNNLLVFAVGGSTTPVLQVPVGPSDTVMASNGMIAITQEFGTQLTLVDVGAAVASKQVTVPPAYLTSFASDGAGHWSVGNKVGVLYFLGNSKSASADGLLGCGGVGDPANDATTATSHAMSGTSSGKLIVATASGQDLVLDATTKQVVTLVAGVVPRQARLTNDGKTLVMTNYGYGLQYLPGCEMFLYALPSLTPKQSWPSSDCVYDFDLARGGSRLSYWAGTQRHVLDLGSQTDVLTDSTSELAPKVSPDGTHIAATNGNLTAIYLNGTLVNAVSGRAIGWIDDNALLVQTHKVQFDAYDKSFVYDATGTLISQPPLMPLVTYFDTAAPGRILDRDDSKIYDTTTGAKVWDQGLPPGATIVGANVAYLSGSAVYLTKY